MKASFLPTIYVQLLLITTMFALISNYFLLKYFASKGQQYRKNRAELVRWAASEQPAIGGLGFFLTLLISLPLIHLLTVNGLTTLLAKDILSFVAVGAVGFIIGLVDDFYTMPPKFKFFGQLLCTFIILASGLVIQVSPYYLVNALFTTFWVVGIMNSINMLDNMDGITGSVSLFIIIGMMLTAYTNGAIANTHLCLMTAMIGGLIGFLYFNRHPAKMYMGDAGSQFLGAILAFWGILFLWSAPTETTSNWLTLRQILLPVLLFLLPIIDTTTVSWRRLARGQSPFVGGRDHTTHHLAYCGLTDKQVSGVFVTLSISTIFMTLVLLSNNQLWTSILVILFICLLFVGMQYFYEKGKLKKQQPKADQPIIQTPNSLKQSRKIVDSL